MEKNLSLFAELPNEILFEILDRLDRFLLVSIVRVNKRIRAIAQYLLEHRKKIRLCGEILRVLVISPPSIHDEIGKISRTERLSANINQGRPLLKKRSEWKSEIVICTRSVLDVKKNTKVVMMECPNEPRYRRKVYTSAVAADLCLLIVDPQEINDFSDYIKDTIFGCCFMMSARNMIVAVNLSNYSNAADSAAIAAFNETRTKVSKLLDSTVGTCYKIIPVDVITGANVIPSVNIPLFKWWSGPSIQELLIADQLRTNFDEPSYKKLCEEPFKFQLMFKHKIGGIGTVLEGRVISGTLKPQDLVTTHPKIRNTRAWSIETHHETKTDAKPGDIVGINISNVNLRELYTRFGCLVKTKETPTVNCTLAFRAQIVVMKPERFTQHQLYHVFYGAARFQCLLWWILPTDGKNHDRSERKFKYEMSQVQGKAPPTEDWKKRKDHEERVKKEKEVHAKTQAEAGINYVRPPKPLLKKAVAVLLPLIHYDIEPYKPTAFEKNYKGKIMMMETSSIIGVGRVDRVIRVTAPKFSPNASKDKLSQYATVVDQAPSLFNLPKEQRHLDLFLNHVTTNEHAKNSLQCFKKGKKI